MNTPVVILSNHREWYVFCELCAANNTTPDKVLLDYITGVNKQAQERMQALAAQNTQPLSFAQPGQPAPQQPEYHSPSEDMTTMDELGNYLQELNKEKAKVEKQNPVDMAHLNQLKNELRLVSKKMLELS